jgi:hypothetical protein
MLPQVVLTDSTKKGDDKLPFAPFLNKEKIESLRQSSSDSLKLKSKKNKAQAKPADQQKLQASAEEKSVRDSIKKGGEKSLLSLTYPYPLSSAKDSIDLISTDSLQLLSANEFRFSDDTTTSLQNDLKAVPYTNSEQYFNTHLLKSDNGSPQELNKLVPDWFTITLLLMIVGVTAIKILYRKIFSQMVAAFFSLSVTNQIVRDENLLVQRATILLNIIFYVVGALFLYQLSITFTWNHPVLNEGIIRFFLFAILLACIYSVKMLLLKALSYVFEIDKPVSTYIFSLFLINNSVGLILIPLIAVSTYIVFVKAPTVIFISLGIIILAFIFRLWRATTIGLSLPRFSLYYLFLYFCALEIAPVVIMLKATGILF